MATETIETDLDGLQDVFQGIFDEVEAVFKDTDYTPLLNDYMGDLEMAHLDYFIGMHDPLGNAWAPLKPATVAGKAANTQAGGATNILFETGDMMNSLVGATSDSIKLVFREGDGAYLVFGTSVEYAHWHMTGTSKMAARPFLGMNEPLLTTLTKATADAVVDGLVKSFQ